MDLVTKMLFLCLHIEMLLIIATGKCLCYYWEIAKEQVGHTVWMGGIVWISSFSPVNQIGTRQLWTRKCMYAEEGK